MKTVFILFTHRLHESQGGMWDFSRLFETFEAMEKAYKENCSGNCGDYADCLAIIGGEPFVLYPNKQDGHGWVQEKIGTNSRVHNFGQPTICRLS